MADRYLNHIGGKWVGAETDTNDLIGLFPKSSQADVDRAVKAATDAFDSWRLNPRTETARRSAPRSSSRSAA